MCVFVSVCMSVCVCVSVCVDPRTTDGYWLRSPEPMMVAVVLYLIFVVVVPRLMENRPPMDLKLLIIAYNFILVAISGYMCIEVAVTRALPLSLYSTYCCCCGFIMQQVVKETELV